MTTKTRYFLIGSGVVLLAGLSVAGAAYYYQTGRAAGVPAGLPDELRYVPASAELVAYADVQAVMNSELRRELERATLGPRRGRSDMNDFAGIDLEKQVNHIVAYLEKIDGGSNDPQGAKPADPRANPPRGLMLAQGTFDQATVEQFIRDHGGAIEDYHGKHMAIHRPSADDRGRRGPAEEMAVGFLQPNLIALGHAELVRRALDLSTNPSSAANVTTNAELMDMVRDASGETAWVVGHFDAVSRRMGMPSAMREQVPPLRMVAAKAKINGGVKATIKAETADQAAADQMRDVIRGFVSLIRMQGGAKPELQEALKSIELGGTGSTVQLSFAMTPETFRAIVPQRGQRPGFGPPAPPLPPSAPPPPARRQ